MKRRRLGQHYLTDDGVARLMAEAAEILPGDKVLEIGTGRGALTKVLQEKSGLLEAYEIDRENYERTLEVVNGGAARVILGDAFRHRPHFDVLVASLPYSQSSVFIEWLAESAFRKAVVLLQDDFVKKVLARPGSRDYRGVSALSQICFNIEVLARVGRASFSPSPRVSSLVVAMSPKARLTKRQTRLIKLLFSLRRKRVATAMAMLKMGPGEGFGDRRVYSLAPEEVQRIVSGVTLA